MSERSNENCNHVGLPVIPNVQIQSNFSVAKCSSHTSNKISPCDSSTIKNGTATLPVGNLNISTESDACNNASILNKPANFAKSFISNFGAPSFVKKPSSFKVQQSKSENTKMNDLTPMEINRRASIQVIQNHLLVSERQPNRRTTVQIVRSWMAPSESPVNLKIFGGSRAVKEEQLRARNAGWVIHPFSGLRYYWDMVIMVLLAVNMVILPLNIAFFYDESLLSWMIFHSISDVLFISDIVLNFRTGYQEDKNGYRLKFILDPKLIARRYIRSWLILDIISSFPIDNVLLIINGGDFDSFGLGLKSASRAFKFMRLAKLLSLLKLLRLSRILRYVSKYEEFYHLTASVMRYIKLVMMMLVVAHWNGCMGFLIPMLQEFPEDSWVRLNGLENSDWSEQYGWALFKALSHMLCIGYGRFIPQLLSEALFTIFSMITGATFYALFIAHSMAYIQQNDPARRQYQEKFKQIEEYMSYRDLPVETRERITEYYEHKYSQKRLFNEDEILSEISRPIRDDIVNHNCRDLIESVPFLRQGGTDFITLIINKLTFDVFLPGDIIIKEGSFGQDMFFIRDGSVDIVAEEQYIDTLGEGDYFGEITMLTDTRRVASVRAATICDMFILNKENLYRALEEFPEMRVVMEQVALDRLMKLKTKFPQSNFTNDAQEDLESRRESHQSAAQHGDDKFSHIIKQIDSGKNNAIIQNIPNISINVDEVTSSSNNVPHKTFVTLFNNQDSTTSARRFSHEPTSSARVQVNPRCFSFDTAARLTHDITCQCEYCENSTENDSHIVI